MTDLPTPRSVDGVTPELKDQEVTRLKTAVKNLRRYRVPAVRIRGLVREAINEVDNAPSNPY